MADPEAEPQLISGFHAIEQNSWRWTAGRFAVLLPPPESAAGARLLLRLSVPEAVLRETDSVTLTAILNGLKLGSQTWSKPGEYTFVASLPAGALGPRPFTIDFALDRFLPAGKVEARELGIIVSSVEIA
jgi:hypothetical protein